MNEHYLFLLLIVALRLRPLLITLCINYSAANRQQQQ